MASGSEGTGGFFCEGTSGSDCHSRLYPHPVPQYGTLVRPRGGPILS